MLLFKYAWYAEHRNSIFLSDNRNSMSRFLRTVGLMYAGKMQSWLNMCNPHGLTTLSAKIQISFKGIPFSKKICEGEKGHSLRTAHDNMGRHFTHVHFAQCSQGVDQIIIHRDENNFSLPQSANFSPLFDPYLHSDH